MATRYGTDSRLKAGEVLKRTVAYFGPEGLGLQVTSRTLTGVHLEGSGGYVDVQVRVGPRTDVDIILHEFEAHAGEFLGRIRK